MANESLSSLLEESVSSLFQLRRRKQHNMADESGIEFLKKLKVLLYDKYDKFIKDKDDNRIVLPVQVFTRRVNALLKAYYLKHYQIPVDHHHQQRLHNTEQKKKKVADNCQLPWDLLDIISRMLDFDDLFQFGSVCKNWREFHKIYWRNFMASQEPLLLQRSPSKKSYYFLSLPHHKVYHSKMINKFFHFAYHGSSSGYLIMTRIDSSFILINPFTRRNMVVNNSVFKDIFADFACQVLLAFSKGSEEFVLVVSCRDSGSLHVYQSRNLGWITYSTPEKVVDFAVLHNIIYVVTDKAKIGILSLNSANINFLKLKSTPSVTSVRHSHVRLVSCNGHLLVINCMSKITYNVYKIDLSTMDYVKLETLGDIALFYAPRNRYYALSNPRMWGYENNCVYVIDIPCDKYRVYKGDENKMPELILPMILKSQLQSVTQSEQPYVDWCFKHLRYEVDYSLVE